MWAPYPKGYKRRPYTPSRTHGRSRCIPPLVHPRFKLLGFRFPLNRRGGSLFSFSFCFLFLFAVASKVCAEDFQVCPFAWPLAELPTFFLSPGLWPKEREGSARGERPPRSWLACWNGWPAGWPGLGRLAGLGRLLGQLAWATLPAGWPGLGWSQPPLDHGSRGVPPTDGPKRLPIDKGQIANRRLGPGRLARARLDPAQRQRSLNDPSRFGVISFCTPYKISYRPPHRS